MRIATEWAIPGEVDGDPAPRAAGEAHVDRLEIQAIPALALRAASAHRAVDPTDDRTDDLTDTGGAEAPHPGRWAVVEPLFVGSHLAAGRTERLLFRLLDAADGEPLTGLRDVQARLLHPEAPGDAQSKWAMPAGDRSAGVYQVDWVFPRAGTYRLAVSAASLGLRFTDLPPLAITIAPPPGTP